MYKSQILLVGLRDPRVLRKGEIPGNMSTPPGVADFCGSCGLFVLGFAFGNFLFSIFMVMLNQISQEVVISTFYFQSMFFVWEKIIISVLEGFTHCPLSSRIFL